jgi:hypothetical protein
VSTSAKLACPAFGYFIRYLGRPPLRQASSLRYVNNAPSQCPRDDESCLMAHPLSNADVESSPRQRRRKGTSRTCPHCSRVFRRIEHLDRHVRIRELAQTVTSLARRVRLSYTWRPSLTAAITRRHKGETVRLQMRCKLRSTRSLDSTYQTTEACPRRYT